MKNLFDKARVGEVAERIARLSPGSQALWGKMSVGQMLAHCSVGLKTATGELKPPRVMVGRILGPIIKPLALRNDEPMKKNSPTAPIFIIEGEPDFEGERAELMRLVDGFAAEGSACCTDHPHAFFGRLKPEEWAIVMYKHLDHHLRQFGV
ncbi:MAG TPA: DUF1569 domain-containing protein [Acidobacteriaceae bacterium]|nr:DUF1569 domain-containing protein [Acidobacteriaceae bacterium]